MVEYGDHLGTDPARPDHLYSRPAEPIRHLQPDAGRLGHHPQPGLLGLAGSGGGKMAGAARLVWKTELVPAWGNIRFAKIFHSQNC
jgi:hypothetical protein